MIDRIGWIAAVQGGAGDRPLCAQSRLSTAYQPPPYAAKV